MHFAFPPQFIHGFSQLSWRSDAYVTRIVRDSVRLYYQHLGGTCVAVRFTISYWPTLSFIDRGHEKQSNVCINDYSWTYGQLQWLVCEFYIEDDWKYVLNIEPKIKEDLSQEVYGIQIWAVSERCQSFVMHFRYMIQSIDRNENSLLRAYVRLSVFNWSCNLGFPQLGEITASLC